MLLGAAAEGAASAEQASPMSDASKSRPSVGHHTTGLRDQPEAMIRPLEKLALAANWKGGDTNPPFYTLVGFLLTNSPKLAQSVIC